MSAVTRSNCRIALIGVLAVTLASCGSDPQAPDVTPPATVSDLTATLAGSSTARLRWTAPGDDDMRGRATRYDIRYATHPMTPSGYFEATRLASPPTPAEGGQPDSVLIGGLIADRTYYFVLVAEDERGNRSDLSNTPQLRTPVGPDTIPPAAILDLRATSVMARFASLTWTAPGDDRGVGLAASYDLRMSTEPIDLATWSTATPVPGVPEPAAPGTSQTLTIPQLDPETRYYLNLRTLDEAGNISRLSNALEFTTRPTPRTWHIRADGHGDAPTIQAGIDSAQTEEVVLVGPGTYYENLIFRGRDITLKSEAGPEATIIDGSRHQESVIQIRNGETQATVVEGFTVTHGVGSNLTIGTGGHVGGGILIVNSSPTIRGNNVQDKGRADGTNTLPSWGGGIYCGGRPSALSTSPLIADNLIRNNKSRSNGAGIGGEVFGAPTIIGNLIKGNEMVEEGDGGGLWLHSIASGTVVRGNRIEENLATDHGGGIYAFTWGADDIEVSFNEVIRNTALGFPFNGMIRTEVGGGIWLMGDAFNVFNNTIVLNRASETDTTLGGGLAIQDSGASIVERNIIAFSRSGGGIQCFKGPSPLIRNNLAWRNVGGAGTGNCSDWVLTGGNLIADPLFCDLDHGDIHVRADSPALLHWSESIGASAKPGCVVDLPSRAQAARPFW